MAMEGHKPFELDRARGLKEASEMIGALTLYLEHFRPLPGNSTEIWKE